MNNEQLNNLHQLTENNQIKNQMKQISKNKSIKKWKPGQNLQKKKPINQYPKKYQTGIVDYNSANNTIKKGFDLRTNTNSKGLFDPNLKLNELDEPSRIKNQRLEKIRKIKEYDLKYGNKIKNIQKYQNYLNSNEENKKNYFQDLKKINITKYSKANKEQLLQMLNIPKPKINSKLNLDFDFSKYENIIRTLEDQIQYERDLRKDTNLKYLQKIREYEDLNSGKKFNNNITLKKRSKSAYRYNNNKKKRNNKRVNKFKRNFPELNKKQINNMSHRVKSVINRNLKLTKEDEFRNDARKMAKSAIKIIDKDFERIYHNLTNKNDNLNNTFSKSFNSNKLYPIENNTYYKTINIQNKYQINNEFNNENSNENVNLKTLSDENKNQFENNVVSQIENQQNNILNKENNILNKDNNKSDNLENIIEKKKQIKNLLFNNSELILKKTNNDKIIKEIINDLLTELVYELQFIEEQKEKKESENIDRIKFTNFLKEYYKNVKDMENIEKEVLSKLSNKTNLLTPYKSITNNLYNNTNEEILNPFDENYIENPLIKKEKSNITILYNYPKVILKAEKYSKEFKEYKISKEPFYSSNNIFNIYDDIVNEITNNIFNEESDYCLKEVDNFVDELYKEEVLKVDLNKE